ncbi:MAG: cytochrome ubiquinol oxidase subunit I, partial [Muribaculaceae bacterium]|nr:cytochrome ubiquinol oxidase subunit I [Muribaculaceae bacterium]
VFSGWVLASVFVVGVSCVFLLRKSNVAMSLRSIKVAGWVGLMGIILTMWTGDGSAVVVSRVQPMKLAAMEGLYHGSQGQSLVGFGILNPDKTVDNNEKEMLFSIDIPYGLSILANHDANSFVPGIKDIIDGVSIDSNGDTINTVSYAERIQRGKSAQNALRIYNDAYNNNDTLAMEVASKALAQDYQYFGYGYYNNPSDLVPPVGVTFYAFRVMVMAGGYLLIFLLLMVFVVYRKPALAEKKWLGWLGVISIPIVWICSQAGWVVAEVGRQPWVIQDLMPTCAGVSAISESSVQLTFWIFAVLFTAMLIADISIMVRYIARKLKTDIENSND